MSIEVQDNPFPSILMVEGDPEDLPDANPASGQRRLAVGADHLLYLVDDAGAKHLVGGSALADPMTTRGDMIVRNASNVTDRVAIGSAGKVWKSDGTDPSWQTPTSGITTSANQLAADVVMTTAGTFYDGPTLTINGTYLLIASVALDGANNSITIAGKLWNGTTVAASAQAHVWGGASGQRYGGLSLVAVVTTSGSETWKVSCTGDGNGSKILAASVPTGSGNNASTLVALKLA